MAGPWTVGGEEFVFMATIQTVPAEIPANQTDFPYYFPLSKLGDKFWETVILDGGDGASLRATLTDGTTQVPIDLIDIDTTAKTGSLWFKGDPSSSVAVTYKIFTGNKTAVAAAIDATYGRENVYDSDYRVVHPLKEDPTAGGAIMLDHTSNQEHGTPVGSMTSSNSVAGHLEHNAIRFIDETDDGINSPWIESYGAEKELMSISAWVKTTTTSLVNLIGAGGPDTNDERLYIQGNPTTSGILRLYVSDGVAPSRIVIDSAAATGFNDGNWHLIEWTWLHSTSPAIASDAKLYIDGSSITLDTPIELDRSSANSDHAYPMGVGYLNYGGGWFNGKDHTQQEIHVSKIRRTLNNHITRYNNQDDPDSFWTVSAEEGGYEPCRCAYSYFIT